MRLVTATRTLGLFAMLFAAGAPAMADEPADALNDQAVRLFRAEGNLVNQALDDINLRSKYFVLLQAMGENAFGATLNAVDESLRTQLGIPVGQGLVVSNVTAGGPAAQTGLQNNDILLRLGGAELAVELGTADALVVALKAAGDKPVTLRLVRAGKPLEIQVKPVYRVTFGPVAPEPSRYVIGVQIDPPDDVLRAHLTNLPAGQGLVATQVLPDSPAFKAGLKPFDILLECGGRPLETRREDLVSQVQGSQGKPITLKALRSGKTLKVDVTPEPHNDKSQAQSAAEVLSLYQPFSVAAYSTTASLNPVLTYNFTPTPMYLAPNGQTFAASAGHPLDQRLDTISTELANLRKSLEELRNSLKTDATKGK